MPAGRARKRWNCRECRANAEGLRDVRSAAMVAASSSDGQQLLTLLVPSQSSRLATLDREVKADEQAASSRQGC